MRALEVRLVEPVAEPVSEAEVEVRPVWSLRLLEQLRRDRRATYARLGVELHDAALDAQRRFGTTIGLFVRGRLIGCFSAWRLSEALCSLGYLLAGVGVERHDPDKVVELASMFLLPEFAKHGYARHLFEAGRTLIAGMRPELIVAFAVEDVADRYIRRYGFRPVYKGPLFFPHPLAPGVKVTPLTITFERFARVHFAHE